MEHPVQPLLKLQYTKHTKVVAFADDILIMIKAETVGEAENIIKQSLYFKTDFKFITFYN